MATTTAEDKNNKKSHHPWLIGFGVFILAVIVLILLWDWNWFKPIVERKASAALGRQVTIGNLHVAIRRFPVIEADKIEVANPPEFPQDSRFGTIEKLQVSFDPVALFHKDIVLPEIDIDQPKGDLGVGPNGHPNWVLAATNTEEKQPDDAKGANQEASFNFPQIGALNINDGVIHFVDPKLKANFTVKVKTVPAESGGENHIRMDVNGTYAGQTVTGYFLGGSVLTLRDTKQPYSVNLQAENGQTRISLKGTVQDPLHFAGADLDLDFRGDDLEKLFPLTAVPFPQTPAYHLTGKLDYADRKIRFRDFKGVVGSSDLEGTIGVNPGTERPIVTVDVVSHKVVLADLAGFIGGAPGKAGSKNDTQQNKAQRAEQAANPNLLPTTPINLPKIRAVDVHMKYKGDHIEGKTPLDNFVANLDIEDGVINLHPLSFGVGTGTIASNIHLDGQQNVVHAKADVDFRKLDVSRIMQSTGVFKGAGTIGGTAAIEARGNSMADLMAHGNGELKLFMTGGDVSAILIDLAGLDLGNTLLSALGLPNRAPVRCMVIDGGLQQGNFTTRTMLFDTTEANVIGKGNIDFRDETVHYQITTEPKHFSVGSLAAPIDIDGRLKSPSIKPDPGTLAARGGAAVGLGVLLTPLGALLPTIQLGLGKDNDCNALLAEAETAAKAPSVTAKRSASLPPKKARKTGTVRKKAPVQQRRTNH